MKLLERLGMVQFFLYELEDLEIGQNTGFFAPNGTGKTSLLDAIQIVMLGGDVRRMHFNARSDAGKHARSLRDYCLGVFGQGDDGRCRDVANTYINLVFRDQVSDAVVTAGISLSASAQSPDITINSLYILPGVALASDSHVETVDGRRTVMPWRRYREHAAQLCSDARTTPLFTTNRQEFISKLLIEHLAGPEDRPNPDAFRGAFSKSLRLRDFDDLSNTLRNDLIEAHRVDVAKFRTNLEQFRAVRELIRKLVEQIERVTEVCDAYATVKRERVAEATFECLKATYFVERLGDSLSEADDHIERMRVDLENARALEARAKRESAAATEARDRARDALQQDPDYRSQAGQAEQLTRLQNDLAQSTRAFLGTITAMSTAVLQAGRLPELEDARAIFEDAATQLAELERTFTAGDTLPAEAIVSVARAVGGAHDAVQSAYTDLKGILKVAKDATADAKVSLERAGRGLSPLRDGTRALMRVLADNGIEATPVCDLVQIKDPRWQPVLEAYLGPHVEALLVSRSDEHRAISLYQGLKGAQAVYGVKLACPSRLREPPKAQGKPLAAELIVGSNPDAVRYLQGELGRVELAQSVSELLSGGKALMPDGMIGTGGSVERRRLPGPDELRIGQKDQAKLRDRAEQVLAECRQKEDEIGQRALSAERCLKALAPFSTGQVLVDDIEGRLAAIGSSRLQADEITRSLVISETGNLAELEAAKQAADDAFNRAREVETERGRAVGDLNRRHEQATEQREALALQMAAATAAEKAHRQNPFYDPNEVERARKIYDERHPELDERMTACSSRIGRARSAADTAAGRAKELFAKFLSDYHQENQHLDDWIAAYNYVLLEKRRLEDLELAEQQENAEKAYQAAVRVFRQDVVQSLLNGFERLEEQVTALNLVLKNAPVFSNNERYQFRYRPLDLHRPLFDFLQRAKQFGSSEEDIFGGAGQVPEEFRALVEGDADSPLLREGSPLADHRLFFGYDVEILRDGKSVGWLSKRIGPGSGGEHRTPLYVIFGAALAAAYGKIRGESRGGGVMLLDEAFEKMDPQNIRAAALYLNALGLQLVLAGPEDGPPKMSSFLNLYYDMGRYGGRSIQMDKTILTDEARELLESDNFLSNPELVLDEMKRIADEGVGANAAD